MKSITRIIIPTLTFIILFSSAFSQKRRHRHYDDAVVTIKINGKEQDNFDIDIKDICIDIGDFAESIGEMVE